VIKLNSLLHRHPCILTCFQAQYRRYAADCPEPDDDDGHGHYVLDYEALALWLGDAAWLKPRKSRQSSETRSQRNLAAGFLFMRGE
jgi:hypothetical protein